MNLTTESLERFTSLRVSATVSADMPSGSDIVNRIKITRRDANTKKCAKVKVEVVESLFCRVDFGSTSSSESRD